MCFCAFVGSSSNQGNYRVIIFVVAAMKFDDPQVHAM